LHFLFSTPDSTAIAEQKRLLAEKTAKIDARIGADLWDIEAWTALINEAQSKDIRVARDIYERFLQQFPTAVK
jgi:peptidoglycan/xylan/chitin deacetylase (PgdA/CDA1 family)